MKIYWFLILLSAFQSPYNDCLLGYYEDAAYYFKKSNYQEAITTYQEAIQNCQLSIGDRKKVLLKLDTVYNKIKNDIEEKKQEALLAQMEAEKDKLKAEISEKKAIFESMKSDAINSASLANREHEDKLLKLKHAYKALVLKNASQILMDSSQFLVDSTKLDNILLVFGEAVRDSFMTTLNLEGSIISDMIALNNQIILAQGSDLIFINGNTLNRINAHDDLIVSLETFNNQIVSAAKNGELKLWNSDGSFQYAFSGHTSKINFLKVNKERKELLSGSTNNKAFIWNQSGDILEETTHSGKILDGNFSIKKDYKFTRTQDNKIYLWNKNLKKEIISEAFIYDAAFLKKGELLITCNAKGHVKLFNTKIEIVDSFFIKDNPAIDITVSQNEEHYIVVFADGSAILGDLSQNKVKKFLVNKLPEKNKSQEWIPFKYTAFSPNDSLFVVSSNNNIQLIHLNGTVDTFFKQASLITKIQFDPTGKMIMTIGTDNSVKVYNKERQLVLDINNLKSPVIDAFFHQEKIIAYTLENEIIQCPIPMYTYKKFTKNPPKWAIFDRK